MQVRTTAALSLVPSVKCAEPRACSLPSVHLACSTPLRVIFRSRCLTEPAPPAIFGIVVIARVP